MTSRLRVVGGVLVLVSAYPAAVVTWEWICASLARRYVCRRVDNRTSVEFHGHRVELSDDFPVPAAERPASRAARSDVRERKTGTLRILIDGRDYSAPPTSTLQIRVDASGLTRYVRQADLIPLSDRGTGRKWMAILQRLGEAADPLERRLANEEGVAADLVGTRLRLLLVAPDGHVSEEHFEFGDRAWPGYRTLLIAQLYKVEIPFTSVGYQVTRRATLTRLGLPLLLVPAVYPLLTVFVGGLLLVREHRWVREATGTNLLVQALLASSLFFLVIYTAVVVHIYLAILLVPLGLLLAGAVSAGSQRRGLVALAAACAGSLSGVGITVWAFRHARLTYYGVDVHRNYEHPFFWQYALVPRAEQLGLVVVCATIAWVGWWLGSRALRRAGRLRSSAAADVG